MWEKQEGSNEHNQDNSETLPEEEPELADLEASVSSKHDNQARGETLPESKEPNNINTQPEKAGPETQDKITVDDNASAYESYEDSVMGIFDMNKTGLPQEECERLKSIANIGSAHLYQSRLGSFSILKYEKRKHVSGGHT